MPFRLVTAATLAAFFMIPSSGSGQVLMQRDVSLRMALTIAEAALAECGINTSVAVVDRAGRLRVLLQGDGASPHNPELARRKAYQPVSKHPFSAGARFVHCVADVQMKKSSPDKIGAKNLPSG